MSSSPIFGPIVTASTVEQATIATLQAWLPTYIAELERREGLDPGSVAAIRSWATVNKFRRAPQEQLPAAIVVSPGISQPPERRGDGLIDAWWRIGVAIVVFASTREATNDLAKLYAAAVRTIIVQKPALAGDPAAPEPLATRVQLISELSDDVPPDYLEVGATGQVEFDVLVEGIAQASTGPAEPTVDVPPNWPVVETPNVDIQLEDPHG